MNANSFRIVAGTVIFLSAGVAHGQWVSFADETGARLSLSTVALDDGEEKDLATGDFDQDGWVDVIIVRKFPFSVPGARTDVLLMNENGILTDRTTQFASGFIATPTDSRDVFVADFTGDGWPDLIIANTFQQQPSFYRNGGNDLAGDWRGFTDESALRIPILAPVNQPLGPQFCAVFGGDIDGDTDLDLYFANYTPLGGTSDVLLVNNGTGVFTDETVARLGSFANVAFGTGSEIYDMDNDGDNDIVKISTLYSVAPFPLGQFILFNDGNGVFNSVPFQTLSTFSPYMFTVCDLNNDGMMDQFLEGDSQDRVAIAQSAVPNSVTYATTMISPSPHTSGFGGNTKSVDLDGDGDLDIAVAPIDVDIANCGPSSKLALLENPGNGQVFDPWAGGPDQNFNLAAHDLAFLDIDNDGCQDMILGLCTGWKVFIQENCPVQQPCPGDVTPPGGNGAVNIDDLVSVLGAFGPCVGCPQDITPPGGNGVVNIDDLISLLGAFGPCP